MSSGTIAFLNVEGKLFFSLLSKLLEDNIVKRNLSVQKGSMPKVPRCWEHMCLVWTELKGAKANKLDLAAVWLDIANDYGSIPCQLILFALEWYGIDPKWVELFKSYYCGLWSKCFSPIAPSSWHQHLTGVFQAAQLEFIELYVLELTSLFFSHSYHHQ